MSVVRMVLKRETLVPLMALVFASAVCMGLVSVRIFRTGNVRYSFLMWNLFLAWVPMVFALLVCRDYQAGRREGWRLLALGSAWLIFFPNAPYICTDLIHLPLSWYKHYWVDLVLILSCAITGLMVGFVSLYLVHGVVKRARGELAGWGFILLVAGLSGIGVYLGRFLRFNSWDIVVRPVSLVQGFGKWLADPLADPTSVVFPLLFGTFLLITYVMVYALTHLRHIQPAES